MKINELLNEAPKKAKPDNRNWVQKADDAVRGSFPMKAIQTMQGAIGKPGPDEKKVDKTKTVTKKGTRIVSKQVPNKKIEVLDPSNMPAVAVFKTPRGETYSWDPVKKLWNGNTEDGRLLKPLDVKRGVKFYNSIKDPKMKDANESINVKGNILKEGGNIFQGTADFDQKIIPDMMKQINGVMTKAGVKALPIGSGATPQAGKMSGDLDMIADAGQLIKNLKAPDVKTAKIELEKMFQQAGFETKKTGQIVHVKTNVGDLAQQVDIMVVDNGETASKFHVHDIPKGSPYKGVHKQIMIADLAKEKGFKWSPYKGLVNRDTNELVSNDLDNIAKQLIGPNATASDLGSVESILAKMPSAKEIVDKYEADPNSAWMKKKPQQENNEIIDALRRI
jgi:hypothetical protein